MCVCVFQRSLAGFGLRSSCEVYLDFMRVFIECDRFWCEGLTTSEIFHFLFRRKSFAVFDVTIDRNDVEQQIAWHDLERIKNMKKTQQLVHGEILNHTKYDWKLQS